MSVDLGISSGADLAGSSWMLPRSSNPAAIPENASFHDAMESAAKKTDSPEKIAGAAKQFEALMVGQILKTARESSGGGWLSDEDDQDDGTGSLVMEMAEQGFAQAIAARGGLGIAKMVTINLERGESKHDAKTPSSDSQAQPASTPPKSSKLNTDWERSAPLAPEPARAPHPGMLPHPER